MNIKNIQELIEGTAISSEPIIFGRGTELRRQSIADFITTFNLGGASGIPNIDIQETSYSNLVILNGTLPSSIPTLITIPDNQLRFIRIAVVSSFTGAISQNLYLLTERGEDLILQDILWSTSILIDSIPFDATEASNTTTYNVSSLAELNASDPALPFNQSGQEYFVNLNGTLYFFVGNPAEYGVGASTMEMTDLQLVSDSSKKSELKTYRVDPNNLAQIISEVNGAGTFILDNPENTLIKAVFISEQGQPFETSTRIYQIITNPNTGLNNLIAGNFGTGGQQINSTNLELIHTSEVTATDISELSNTVTFEYNIGAGNLIDFINDLDPSIVVANPNTNLTLFRITANGVLFEYLYVGDGATYGINDDEITTSDLQLVNDESSGVTNIKQKLITLGLGDIGAANYQDNISQKIVDYMTTNNIVRLPNEQHTFKILDNPFFVGANGVTIILKEGYGVGTTGKADGDVSGQTYTAVSEAQLRDLEPTTDDYTVVCTSLVTDINALFQYKSFNQNIGNWDLSNVINTNSCFAYSSFNQNIENWDVSNVTSMASMFQNSASFNQNIENWDVSNVTSMANMFQNNPSFNQPLNNWDVSNVTSMIQMFLSSTSFNQPLNNWNVSSVTSMANMFLSSTSFNQPLNNWDTSSITNMDTMFRDAEAFNQNLSGWCVTNIASEPSNFDNGATAWVLANSRPIWGTCP